MSIASDSGVPVPDDLRRIATTLLAGDETARNLAGRIVNGRQRHVTVLALGHPEWDTLSAVLRGVRTPVGRSSVEVSEG